MVVSGCFTTSKLFVSTPYTYDVETTIVAITGFYSILITILCTSDLNGHVVFVRKDGLEFLVSDHSDGMSTRFSM